MLKTIYWLTSLDASSALRLFYSNGLRLGMCPPPRSKVKWCSSCEVNTAEFLRCWFEVLFIVATNEDVRTVARQSYTGAREKLTELARSQKGEAIPPPYVPSRGSNIIHQGQLMKMSAASA